MLKSNYVSYLFIFLISILSYESHAETTTIDLNINKNNSINRSTKNGKMRIGCDKLCISYRSKRCNPTFFDNKNLLLGGNEGLLSLLTHNTDKTMHCNISEYPDDIYYFDAGLGRAINYINGEQKIKRTPTLRFPDTFKAESIARGALLFTSGGYVWKFNSLLIPYASLGLEYSYITNAKMHGSIYAKAEIPAYLYQYSISHSNLRLLGKVNLYKWKSFMPYASLGLGGSCNILEDYKEYSLTQPRTVPTSFKNQKDFEFSYSIGLGLDYQCRKDFLLSLGYRYDNFGFNPSGDALGLYKNQHLSNSFFTNSIVLTGRYLFS
ncbi:MAG: hypothetical protein REH83_02760 [Rickettsiella sp.]|nr:hypothetical protein [Rickettsiella sp.]